MNNEQILEVLTSLEKQVKSLKYNALHISWYMRGGVSYEDAVLFSKDERDMVGTIIKENMEITKKSGLPYF